MGYLFNYKYLELKRNFNSFVVLNKQSQQFLSNINIFQNFSFFFQKCSQFKFILKFFKNSNITPCPVKMYIVRFYLKGIGYKFLRSKRLNDFFRIELGHSVSLYVHIPNTIKIFTKRDKLIIISSISSKLIEFSKRIFSLRPADVYKGKGIRLSSRAYTKFKPGKQR